MSINIQTQFQIQPQIQTQFQIQTQIQTQIQFQIPQSNTINIPKIAQDTMLGIRSPPLHMIYDSQSYAHSRKNFKDLSKNIIHEENNLV